MSGMAKACILTVAIECLFFWLLGRRTGPEQAVIALTNVVTNLSLNLFLSLVPSAYYAPWIYLLELTVVAAEYLIYKKAFGVSRWLLLQVFCANLITYCTGLLLVHLGLL